MCAAPAQRTKTKVFGEVFPCEREYRPSRRSVRRADDTVFVQRAVRAEPLVNESDLYVQPIVRASQLQSRFLDARLRDASAPESDSPLFNAFGLSARRHWIRDTDSCASNSR